MAKYRRVAEYVEAWQFGSGQTPTWVEEATKNRHWLRTAIKRKWWLVRFKDGVVLTVSNEDFREQYEEVNNDG